MSCKMTTLWQRLGRAVRDQKLEGIGVVFVEAKYFDEEKERLEKARARRREKKRKAETNKPATKATKRARTSDATEKTIAPPLISQ